jgi:hypothetical protein
VCRHGRHCVGFQYQSAASHNLPLFVAHAGISWLGDDPVGCPKIAFAYVCVYGPKEALIRAGTSITGLRPYQSQADTLYFEAAQYAKLRYAVSVSRWPGHPAISIQQHPAKRARCSACLPYTSCACTCVCV